MLQTLDKLLLALATGAFIYFSYFRGLIYLRYFQQEEYDAKRFLNWMWQNKAFDKRGAVAVILAFLVYHFSASTAASLIVLTLCFCVLAYFQKDPRKAGKIKLNMTARAKRIFSVAECLYLLLLIICCFPCLVCHVSAESYALRTFVGNVVLLQLLPICILVANFLLSPFEKWTKQKYLNEAKAILAKVNPYVIGITGSYGKTSVKAALGEVMNAALAPTFCPPKSINTVMGITREIRENMKPSHKYAVIEMGAYNVGSVKRLCDFTPPNAAIVTVVGMAHLERYGTVERVYEAKSELPQALPDDAIFVCNGDNEGTRKMSVEYPKEKTFLYGFQPDLGHLDCCASNVEFTLEGTSFDLHWESKKFKGFTKLHGIPALSNLLGVFTMACALGADPELVLATLRNIQPVDNRLSLSKEGSAYFLRDAYNSNPSGFAAALDVLSKLPAQRKILMTPGMIELGTEQYSQNKIAGSLAANCCDLVILVGETNVTALKEGLLECGFEIAQVLLCKTREQAFQKLNDIMQPEDLILIENDLPDLYEMEERF